MTPIKGVSDLEEIINESDNYTLLSSVNPTHDTSEENFIDGNISKTTADSCFLFFSLFKVTKKSLW